MFALSTFARRSAMMASTRASLTVTPMAAFGTQAQAKVIELEDMLKNLHWDSMCHNVKEIRELMNEKQTNRAIPEPDAGFQGLVTTTMEEIQNMIANPDPKRDEVQAQISGLKMMIREKLYHG